MNLSIKDISHLLMLPEKSIRQLIKNNQIPFQILDDEVFFNKHQIIEWALGRSMPINISNHKKFHEYHLETINTLLDKKSFFYNCNLTEESYIEKMTIKLDLKENIDREIIIHLLKSREEMMSTAIGNGISLPHPRVPLMVGKNKPLVNFFFPNKPLDLKSIDGKPVHTIVLIISQTIKQHLSLIAHLSFLLSKETFRSALESRQDTKELLDIIKRIEGTRGKISD